MCSINNISFDTDGKTVKVPPEKGNGKITLATEEELIENKDEYIPYCQVYENTKEDVEKTEKRLGTDR